MEEEKSLDEYGTKYILQLKDEARLLLNCKGKRKNLQESANILVPGLQSQEVEAEPEGIVSAVRTPWGDDLLAKQVHGTHD